MSDFFVRAMSAVIKMIRHSSGTYMMVLYQLWISMTANQTTITLH